MKEPFPPDDKITPEMMERCGLCGQPALRYGCEPIGDACRGTIITRHVNEARELLTAEEEHDIICSDYGWAPVPKEVNPEVLARCKDRFDRDEAWRARFGPDEQWSRRLIYDTPLRARLGQQAELARERAHPENPPNVCPLCKNFRDRYRCEGRTCRGLLVTPSATVPVCMLTAEEEFDLILGAAYESSYKLRGFQGMQKEGLLADCEKRFARDQAWRELVGPDCTWDYRLENDEAFRDAYGHDDDRPQGRGR